MVLKRHQDLELYDKSSCFLSYRDCYVVGKDPFDPFGAFFDDGSHSWNATLALPIVLIRFKQSGKREDHPVLSVVAAATTAPSTSSSGRSPYHFGSNKRISPIRSKDARIQNLIPEHVGNQSLLRHDFHPSRISTILLGFIIQLSS